MAINVQYLEQLLLERFPDSRVYLEDERGDGTHLYLEITSSEFVNLSKVKIHQLIYQTLGSHMKDIHALSIKAGAC